MPPLASLIAVMRTLVDVLLARLCSCSKIHSVPRSTSVRIVCRTSRGPSGKGNLRRAQPPSVCGAAQPTVVQRVPASVNTKCFALFRGTWRVRFKPERPLLGTLIGQNSKPATALAAVGPRRGVRGERGPARARSQQSRSGRGLLSDRWVRGPAAPPAAPAQLGGPRRGPAAPPPSAVWPQQARSTTACAWHTGLSLKRFPLGLRMTLEVGAGARTVNEVERSPGTCARRARAGARRVPCCSALAARRLRSGWRS
jgi:hypothetical protein